jgi:hypothetical protein
MLVIEHHSNGQRIVKIKKDWHPAMLGKSYTGRNYVDSKYMERLQESLLRNPLTGRKQ